MGDSPISDISLAEVIKINTPNKTDGRFPVNEQLQGLGREDGVDQPQQETKPVTPNRLLVEDFSRTNEPLESIVDNTHSTNENCCQAIKMDCDRKMRSFSSP